MLRPRLFFDNRQASPIMKKNLFILTLALGLASAAYAIDGTVNQTNNNQQFGQTDNNPTNDIDFDNDIDNEDVVEEEPAPALPGGGRSLLSPRVDAIGMITGEADFLVNEGLRMADGATAGAIAPFAGVGFSTLRHKSNPNSTDSDTWYAAAGAFKKFDNLFVAVAGLYGKTDFDLNTPGSSFGSGDANALAGAVFANWKDEKTGWHADGSAILGRMKSDYNVGTRTHAFAASTNYNDKASYCSANVGAGREFAVGKGDNSVDLYARYYFGHSNASNVSVGGVNSLRYSGVDSHRLLVGARYIMPVTETTKVYVGTGWMYEMGGDVEANFLGTRTSSCSVEGHSGMVEIGTRFNPFTNKSFTLDLSVSGWLGVQRGINLGFGGKYSF